MSADPSLNHLAQAVLSIFQPTRQGSAQMQQLLRCYQPILRDQAADLVGFGRSLLGQFGANAVYRLDILLLHILYRD